MFDFFKKKQLSEYTDDEIRDKLSSVLSPDTNPNYINNIQLSHIKPNSF